MRPAALAVAALLLAGCAADPANYSTESSSTTPTPSAAEVCQTVADEVPTSAYTDSSEWEAYASTLEDIEAPEGLLDDLREAAETLADDPTGSELLDASRDVRGALEDLNEECKAAGSDALA